MSVMILVQARMTSSRFPAKVLQPLLDKPMLLQQVQRLERCTAVDGVFVITSTEDSDDPIVSLCQANGIEVFRGPLADVLQRYALAAASLACEHIVRVTGDCPLISPQVIDAVVNLHLNTANDYTANCLQRSFPLGLDNEILTAELLQWLAKRVKDKQTREHVTHYVRRHAHHFKVNNLVSSQNHADKRWTVDYPCDLRLVREVYQRLYTVNPVFEYEDILALYGQAPHLAQINHKDNVGEGVTTAQAGSLSVSIG